MGLSKTALFSESHNELAALASALAHPARIKILEHLIATETCICGDIVEEVGLAQPTISQHLKALKKVGLIQGTISGTTVCYCINQEVWVKVKNTISDFFSQTLNRETFC